MCRYSFSSGPVFLSCSQLGLLRCNARKTLPSSSSTCTSSDLSVSSANPFNRLPKATAFGMKSVVYVPPIKLDTVSALSSFCDKASMVSTGAALSHQLCP